MTAGSSDRVICIETSRGLSMRTAPDLKAMITELLTNSGEEIALWGEQEAKRCADLWRLEAAATPDLKSPEEFGRAFEALGRNE